MFDPTVNMQVGTMNIANHVGYAGGDTTAGLDSSGTAPGYSASVVNCSANLFMGNYAAAFH